MTKRPDYLPDHIREQLIHDPRVAEQDLKVEVNQKRAVVGGHVATPEIRERITEVARELLPGYEVVNEVSIVSATEPEGEEPVS